MPRELKNLVLDEVSCVDRPANPGAKIVLLKRDTQLDEIADLKKRIEALTKNTAPAVGAHTKESSVATLTETLVKALQSDPSDNEKDAARKAVIKMQLERGVLKAEAFAAELVLEARAREMCKSGNIRYEAAYCKALESDRDLIDALYS